MFSKIIQIFYILVFLFIIFPQKINAQILINEFNPKNPEWVELINTNASEINLAGYFFDDDSDFNSDAGNSPKVSVQGLFQPSGLCYIDLSTYLNDGGDTPTLFAPNGDIQDTYTYTSSSDGLSYSRVPDAGSWQINTSHSKTTYACSSLTTPTPIPTQTITAQPTSTPTMTSTPTIVVTVKPSSTKTPTPKSTPTPTPTETPQETSQSDNLTSDTEIVNPTPTGIVAGAKTAKKFPILAIILIISGIGCLGYGGYFLYNVKYANKGSN